MTTEGTLIQALSAAGLEVIEIRAATWSLPVEAAWMATACSPADGRVDELVPYDDDLLVEKANNAWLRLAHEYGLFSENCEFLLSVKIGDDRPQWALVRLASQWDLIGRGTENGVLGGPRGRPGFVMSSLNASVLIAATTWETSVGVLAVPDPRHASAIRRYALGMLKSGELQPRDIANLRRWLEVE